VDCFQIFHPLSQGFLSKSIIALNCFRSNSRLRINWVRAVCFGRCLGEHYLGRYAILAKREEGFTVTNLAKSCLFLLLSCAAAFAAEKPKPPIRTVRLCALDDSANPVPEALIRQYVRQASDDYFKHVRIQFALTDIQTFSDTAQVADIGEFTSCPNSEITVLFTDRHKPLDEGSKNIKPRKGARFAGWLGWSWDPGGKAILYDAASRVKARFNPRWVLEHEIAHQFGLDHDTDPHGFMTEDFDDGKPAWTKKIREEINNKRNTVFDSR